MTDMAPLNPVDIENHIRELVNRIAKGIRVCNERYVAFLESDLAYDREYAKAYLRAEGSIKDKEKIATLETLEVRGHRDVADAAYRHADKLAKALDLELRAYQSLGASVRQMFATAGRGES
ncbi:hypothetical protein [Corynebacterium pyruviciproducens]